MNVLSVVLTAFITGKGQRVSVNQREEYIGQSQEVPSAISVSFPQVVVMFPFPGMDV